MKTMKVETIEDALLHTFDLWLWCAVSGKDKALWPGWKYNGGRLEYCCSNCPLCAYTATRKISCCFCPIKWSEDGSCSSEDSPYNKWELSTTKEERCAHALEVAELAMDALYKLYK